MDVEHFAAEERSAARAALGAGTDEPLVGFVGRVVREKGVVELVEAMGLVIKRFPRARLLIVGDNDRDTGAKTALRVAIDRNGLAGKVICSGYLDDVRVALYAMDIFVLPSHREGLPLTIMEAMAAGKPVVATNIRGCREEVVHGETGLLVPVGDIEALAAALVDLLSQPQRALEMGQRGRQRALAHFNERDALDRQVAAYRRLMQQRLQAAPLVS